jgi:hypothetical protein
MPASDRRVVLVIGISRGIGRGLAADLLRADGQSSARCAPRKTGWKPWPTGPREAFGSNTST